MKLTPLSDHWGETCVIMAPSDPEGYFINTCDVFMPPYRVDQVTLTGLKSRHVRALRRGDDSKVRRYITNDSKEPDRINFSHKIEVHIGDPLNPGSTVGAFYVYERSPASLAD